MGLKPDRRLGIYGHPFKTNLRGFIPFSGMTSADMIPTVPCIALTLQACHALSQHENHYLRLGTSGP